MTTQTPISEEELQLEGVAMNIVHQIGDALYEALPKDVAHEHFVTARQATNDVAIDFAKQLIKQYGNQCRVDELKHLWDTTQPDIIPVGAEPYDMSKRLHERISELTQTNEEKS